MCSPLLTTAKRVGLECNEGKTQVRSQPKKHRGAQGFQHGG